MDRILEIGFVKTASVLQEKFAHLNEESIVTLCDAIVQDFDSLNQKKSQSQASTAKNSPDHAVSQDSFNDASPVGGDHFVMYFFFYCLLKLLLDQSKYLEFPSCHPVENLMSRFVLSRSSYVARLQMSDFTGEMLRIYICCPFRYQILQSQLPFGFLINYHRSLDLKNLSLLCWLSS
jgi:hypothetical protein